MCGIFTLLNNSGQIPEDLVMESFEKARSRGPETTNIKMNYDNLNMMFGFHRLAINGLNNNSDQPIEVDNCLLVCNGEIYNYHELYHYLPAGQTAKTDSDCEVIIHMYKKFGIEYTLSVLDGVFAFALYDKINEKMFVARDPYGVRPLYKLTQNDYNDYSSSTSSIIGFASEMKQLSDLKSKLDYFENPINIMPKCDIEQFTPGTYMALHLAIDTENTNKFWKIYEHNKYTVPGFQVISPDIVYEEILPLVRQQFIQAVRKRVIGTTERPIACLLSGGLDSSLVTAIVSRMVPNLETYSIGLQGSEDLKYAKKVADFLKTNHHEIIVSEEDFFNAIPEVISKIESYDTTTVRASVGNYLVAKYISENSSAKVIFNGDGSDELMGGYLYMHAAPNKLDFDYECRRLLSQIHYFDVLRSDRSISTNGLEPRTPFLDRGWVQFFLSIPSELRHHAALGKCEKYIIREAFSGVNHDEGDFLPNEVLFRTKEAFSDGVSSQQKSWFEIIAERVKEKLSSETIPQDYTHNPPQTLEQYYYRKLYDEMFPNCEHCIPYFWMPRFVEATDSSARTLNVYNEQMSD